MDQPESRIKKLHHKGNEIHYADYSEINMFKDESYALELLKHEESVMSKLGNGIQSLTDVKNSRISSKFMDEVKVVGLKHGHKFNKEAIVGLSVTHKILLRTYNLFTGSKVKPFSTKEEALEFLIE